MRRGGKGTGEGESDARKGGDTTGLRTRAICKYKETEEERGI
jgi:hypothetical protein